MDVAEMCDHVFSFFRLCRARTIDQHPTRPQDGGHRFENLLLEIVMPEKHRRVFVPLGFGMSAQYSEPAARGIEKNSIDQSVQRHRGPARFIAALAESTQSFHRLSCISNDRHDDGDSQSTTILLEEIQPSPLPIQGNNLASIVHQLGKMCGLATRRSTGIENEVARLRIEEWGNELGRFIFDIEIALLKSGE
jgi:hypothetical protein